MKVWSVILFLSIAAAVSAQDAMDPNSIQILGTDVGQLSWRQGARITHIEMTSTDFIVRHTGEDLWPEAVPPGWKDPIQSTLYIVFNRKTTGSIELWKGLHNTRSPLSSGARDWWFREGSIGQPQPGDTIGVFLAAGDQRLKDVRTIEERTSIVSLMVPASGVGVFDFAGPVPPTPPIPPPPPTPPTPPAQTPPVLDLSGVTAQLDALMLQLKAHDESPSYFVKIFGNRYVQMVLTAAAAYFTTHQMMKVNP